MGGEAASGEYRPALILHHQQSGFYRFQQGIYRFIVLLTDRLF
jgi:hypothetical protein